jgi:hypothetical protein
MDILRVPPFPLSIDIEGLLASTDYLICIMNSYAEDLSEIPATSDVNGGISTPIPDYYARYDADYRLEVYENIGSNVRGDLVYVDTLSIYRPYIDVISSLSSPEEIAEAEEYEAVVRAMIDAHTDGFTFKRSTIELTGNGSDFLPVMHRMTKVVRVYENNVLVYDAENEDPDWSNITEYSISKDRTSIIETISGEVNRYDSRPFRGREVGSDSFTTADYPYEAPTKVFPETNWASFPDGWDYTIVIEHGYPVIPQDIQKAAKILYSDLKCGNIQYRNSYIKEYESVNQFKIKIDERSMNGTGNILVDNILSKYPKTITGIGVI